MVFWIVAPYTTLAVCHLFEGKYHLHLQAEYHSVLQETLLII
jgi:hypothetical protein